MRPINVLVLACNSCIKVIKSYLHTHKKARRNTLLFLYGCIVKSIFI